VTFRNLASALGPLASALARTRGAFTGKRPAVDIINTLAAAQSAGRLQRATSRYLKPRRLIVDELGYLPIDKLGADLLFRSARATSAHRWRSPPTASTIYKHWSQIFNNDSTLTFDIRAPLRSLARVGNWVSLRRDKLTA